MARSNLQNFLKTLNGDDISFCIENCNDCCYHNNCKLESIIRKNDNELDSYLNLYLTYLVQAYYERNHTPVNYTWETSKKNTITCKQEKAIVDPSLAIAIGQNQCKRIREIREQYLTAPTD